MISKFESFNKISRPRSHPFSVSVMEEFIKISKEKGATGFFFDAGGGCFMVEAVRERTKEEIVGLEIKGKEAELLTLQNKLKALKSGK